MCLSGVDTQGTWRRIAKGSEGFFQYSLRFVCDGECSLRDISSLFFIFQKVRSGELSLIVYISIDRTSRSWTLVSIELPVLVKTWQQWIPIVRSLAKYFVILRQTIDNGSSSYYNGSQTSPHSIIDRVHPRQTAHSPKPNKCHPVLLIRSILDSDPIGSDQLLEHFRWSYSYGLMVSVCRPGYQHNRTPFHSISAFDAIEGSVDSAIKAISSRLSRVSATVLRTTCATPPMLPKLQQVLKTSPTQLPSSLHSLHVL